MDAYRIGEVAKEAGENISLEVTGPDGTKGFMSQMFPRPFARTCRRHSFGGRLGRSGVAVALVSLVVCELPLLLVVLGIADATFAADPSATDTVWQATASATLSIPLLIWIWRRRSRCLPPLISQCGP